MNIFYKICEPEQSGKSKDYDVITIAKIKTTLRGIAKSRQYKRKKWIIEKALELLLSNWNCNSVFI